jgi:hypothetical protein
VLPSKHKNSSENHYDARQQDRPPIWSADRPDGVASPENNFIGFLANLIPQILNQQYKVWIRKSLIGRRTGQSKWRKSPASVEDNEID